MCTSGATGGNGGQRGETGGNGAHENLLQLTLFAECLLSIFDLIKGMLVAKSLRVMLGDWDWL